MNPETHHLILRQLLGEVYEINERIMCGDICSNKTALPRCNKMCADYAKQFAKIKCADVRLEPYLAAGGWVGITFSYTPEGMPPNIGSITPRRFET